MKTFVLFSALVATSALATDTTSSKHIYHDTCAHGGGFLPANDLDQYDTLDTDSGITEAQFQAVIAKAKAFYNPIVSEHGGELSIQSLWNDSTVNASAGQFGTDWKVSMYGGLARRSEVTVDGFGLVLCHEIGHHLAGYAFASSWAANEGESDYFATQSCARELWGDDKVGNEAARAHVPELAKKKCDDVWSTTENQNLCYRIMLGSESISKLLATLGGSSIKWDTTDPSTVSRTNNAHPRAQCRFDTYMSGALCHESFDKTVIPGKDLGSRRNSVEAEREAMAQSCTTAGQFTAGNRPRCWFAPQVN